MIKVSIAALAALASVGTVSADFRDASCGSATVTFNGYQGRIQCDYTDRASEHYMLSAGVHNIWAYTDDGPHSPNAHGRNPRTEVTMEGRTPYTNRDIAEFSGSVFIPETTRAPFCLFQIKNAADQGSRATTAMLHHYDGAIKWYAGDTFARNVKGRWVSFKVVHDGPKGDIHMTVDGQYKKYAAEKTVRNFGFKFGVYGINKQNKVHEKFQANFKDIQIKVNGKIAVV